MYKTQGNELSYMPTDSRDTTVRERMNTLKRTGSSIEQVDESVSPLQTAQENISTEQAMGESEEMQNPSSPALRRSTRLRRPPKRYGTVVSFRDSDSELEN